MLPVTVLVTVLVMSPGLATASGGRCESVRSPVCQDAGLLYNMTLVPNGLGHSSQEEANYELRQFVPLVKVECSASLKPFLCLAYFPVCTILEEALPPCRELCQKARDGCEPLMLKFGMNWPDALQCDRLPPAGGLCVSHHGVSSTPETSSPAPQVSVPTDAPSGVRLPVVPSQPPTGSPQDEVSCACPSGSTARPPLSSDPAGLDSVLSSFLSRSENIHQLQLRNLQLEQQKLQLEIELLQRKLAQTN